MFSTIPSSWLVIFIHKNTKRSLTAWTSLKNISSAALPQSGLVLKLIVLETWNQALRKILSKCWMLIWQTTAAGIYRKIFDLKRLLLGELFPNIAAAFNVGLVEPKFDKEIQSSLIEGKSRLNLGFHHPKFLNLDITWLTGCLGKSSCQHFARTWWNTVRLDSFSTMMFSTTW